jgi:hypothetical protein
MPSSVAPELAAPLPPGRYLIQLAAPNDPPPSGRFAVERVARRNVDERVQAEFAICAHIDLLGRELREGDRVHVVQRYRGTTRSLVRRVEVKRGSVLLRPLKTMRGRKAEPIDAGSVALMGFVVGAITEYRV